MNDFDKKAATWDSSKMHTDRSKAIAKEIISTIGLNKGMNALEYGAGTGLLSFELKDKLGKIVLMDSSTEMINVARQKIELEGVMNISGVCLDLEKEEYTRSFDLIYNQMVFHHVNNIDKLLQKFFSLLGKGGNLVIADLYPEDGSFHGEGFTGHNGFDPEILGNTLKTFGFDNIRHRKCYSIEKMVAAGIKKEFPLFILTATKL